MGIIKPDRGFTLTEILVSLAIIALVFTPMMLSLRNSLRATFKDDAIIKAMNLTQNKLDTALRFDFDFYKNSNHLDNGWITQPISDTKVELTLGDETLGGVNYHSKLKIEDRAGNFSVPVLQDVNTIDNTALWSFEDKSLPYSGLVHRYTVEVTWRDTAYEPLKYYRLVTFRADLRTGKS